MLRVVYLATAILGLALSSSVGASEPDLRPDCAMDQPEAETPDRSVLELLGQLYDPANTARRCDVVGALGSLADSGDSSAALALGDEFAAGRYLAHDESRALDMYLLASDLGDAKGLLRAGDLFGSASAAPNPATANAYYADALAAGALEGAVRLGEFMAGSGNADMALDYFRQAAEGGVAEGIVHMAALYETSALGAPDFAKAETLYREAMAAGDPTAAGSLAKLLVGQGRRDDAIELLASAGDNGNALALEALGDIYFDDTGIRQDVPKAADLYQRAAELGQAAAALKLGDLERTAATPDIPAALAAYRQVPDEGQLRIGDMYRDGLGVDVDAERAIAAYGAAFAAGSDIAAERLGLLYLEGTLVPASTQNAAAFLQYVPGSIPTDKLVVVGEALLTSGFGESGTRRALGLFERAIAKGDKIAAARLGELYFKGEGVARDLATAESYFLQSPAGIPVSVLVVLGDAHRDGAGMPQDFARANQLYELALAADVPDAAMRLGEANDKPGSTRKAVDYYARAAKLGVSEAYLKLGDLHAGKNGADVDAAAAIAAYRAAIAAGQIQAASKLGDIYFDGALVPRDLGEAERAYQMTPEGVPARAFLDLGLYYRGSDGGPADGVKSVAYLERALAGGQVQAATALGEIYADGRLVPIDPAKADAYFARSGAAVPVQAGLALGEAYRTGINVRADGAKAVRYLEAALAGGLTQAALSLGEMYLDGQLVQADPALVLRYLEPVMAEVPDAWRIGIGDIYRDGSAGSPDGTAAREQYERAVAANIPGAAARLANLLFDSGLVPPDIGRAAELWEATPDGVPGRALLAVADHYRDAGDTTGKAINYYQSALAAGDQRAGRRLADIFLNGATVERDLAQAEHYYQSSGEGVPSDKLMTFAAAYESGNGITQSGARAAEYYEAALDAGETAALLPLGQLYYKGELVPKDLLRAADLLDQTGPGLPASQLHDLGDAFLHGTGVPADPARGAAYLEKALGAGDRTVLASLGDLYLRGEGVSANLAAAAHYLLGAAREGDAEPLFSLVQGHLDGSLPGGSVAQGIDILRQAVAADIAGAPVRLSDVLIVNADAAGGIAVLEAALSGGDMDAGKRLLAYYLDGVADQQPQIKEANRVLAVVSPALDAEEVAYAAVMVSGRMPGAEGALQRMTENFGKLPPDLQSQALRALKRGNENVYVYLLQSILLANGYSASPPSGQLTSSTIRAILALCQDIGSQATCAAGPLSDASTEAIAAGLAAGLGSHPQ